MLKKRNILKFINYGKVKKESWSSSFIPIEERGRNPIRLSGWVLNWLISGLFSWLSLKKLYIPGQFKIVSNNELQPSLSRQAANIDLVFILKNLIEVDSKILEIGCGKGANVSIVESLPEWEGNYIGIDLHSDPIWNKLQNKRIEFQHYDIFEYPNKKMREFDIIFSHSVLEHVQYDLTLITKLATVSKCFQIHCVPGRSSPIPYPFHGYRNYDKYKINKIKKIYESNGFSFVVLESGNLFTSIRQAFFSSSRQIIKRNVFAPFVILFAYPQIGYTRATSLKKQEFH